MFPLWLKRLLQEKVRHEGAVYSGSYQLARKVETEEDTGESAKTALEKRIKLELKVAAATVSSAEWQTVGGEPVQKERTTSSNIYQTDSDTNLLDF